MLIVALVLAPIPVVKAEETNWIGYTAISDKAELNHIRNNLSGKYYLTKDIVFTPIDFANGGDFYNEGAGWIPIGTDEVTAFNGVLDGNGFNISGLYCKISQSIPNVYIGLFGYNKGTIQNLGMINGNIQGISTSLDSDSNVYVGGILGYNYNGNISNCYFTGKVSSEHSSYNSKTFE